MDPMRGRGVKSAKQAEQRPGSAALSPSQAVAHCLVTRRTREEAIQQGPEVETGSPGYDRHASPSRDLRQHAPRLPGVLASGKNLIRIENVDEVVGNALALRSHELGRADIEITVHLQRIAVHYLP